MAAGPIKQKHTKPLPVINGYKVKEILFSSTRSCVYRAVREADQKSVILKILQENQATIESISRYRHEFEVLKSLKIPLVPKAYDLDRYQGAPMLILEDIGGVSLRALRPFDRLSLGDKLDIGIKVSGALGQLHQQGMIHKDVNSSNIVYNPETKELRLIDFGISSHMEREEANLQNLGTMEGSLPYISPEQTGRMNRSVDYRTDLYSLGVTLFELFTSKLPFDFQDDLKIIHYHIAKNPCPPHQLRPSVPPLVSDIILKLMKKPAEERYQSAWGLRIDLNKCHDSWKKKGVIRGFELAKTDIPDRFLIPEKLYGRQDEVSKLLQCFDRICDGEREIMLVGGYSGVGKTSLIREIYKPITGRRGYFLSGKFVQQQENAPYSAILNAIKELVQQLLSENEKKLLLWKQKILEAVSPNGQILIDAVPDLINIIGPQPDVPELKSAEAQKNRFSLVFRNFVQVFCRPEHPLVLFLDDLQWIDSSSLSWLTMILSDQKTRHIMFIGSFRENEVHESSPFLTELKGIGSLTINRIVLRPLGLAHLNEMIRDSLHCTLEESFPLSKLIMEKTSGNPFFTEQFLKSLINDKLLTLDPMKGHWTWDLAKIKKLNMTDNVAHLLTSKIKTLDEDLQLVLQLAACIGHQFDFQSLQMISSLSDEQIKDSLDTAVDLQFIRVLEDHSIVNESINTVYQFHHDRFHQAAYDLISHDMKISFHHRIGEIILSKTETGDIETKIFDIVGHLNRGIPMITKPGDRIHLANLNKIAGEASMKASAYGNALNHFEVGLSLLAENAWEQNYQLCLNLHTQGAHAAFLSSEFKVMNVLVERVIKNSKDLLDSIPAYEVSVQGAVAQNNLRDAAILGRKILRELGAKFPEKVNLWHIAKALASTRIKLSRHSRHSILRLPPMTDRKALARINFQVSLAQCLFFTDSKIIPLIICDAIKSSLKNGNAEVSSYIYSTWGMVLAGVFNDYKGAVKFGLLGARLYRQLNGRNYEAPLLVSYNVFIRHWTEHLSKTLPPLERAFHAGLEVGDQEFAAHAGMAYCYHSFFASRPLGMVRKDLESYHESISRMNQKGGIYILHLFQQLCENLVSDSNDPTTLSGSFYDEATMLDHHKKVNDLAGIFATCFIRMVLLFLFGKNQKALHYSKLADQYILSVVGTIHFAQFKFFQTLVLTSTYADQTPLQKPLHTFKIKRNIRLIKKWARIAPMNHLHKLLLVNAQWAQCKGDMLRAQRCYDLAAKAAKKNSYLLDLAIINEHAARHYLLRESSTVAGAYMKKARYYFERWGGHRKVKDLDTQYPQLLVTPSSGTIMTTTMSSISSTTIDIATLKKALIAIAEEKVHSKMIEKIISSALQFAGAQRGCLLLKKDDQEFFIEADGSVGTDSAEILQSVPFNEAADIPHPVINYVINTGKYIAIDNAQVPSDDLPGVSLDQYVRKKEVKSILCVPIKVGLGNDAKMVGILYLENRITASTFTAQRVEILEIICLAAAGRLELSLKAATDGLTGLYNHEYFKNILQKEILQSRRQLRNLSLIMIDIDHFKKFNDDWGHQVGDLVLKKVATAIQTVCRKSDVVARYGGEEMAVVLPETDPNRAKMVAERIRLRIEGAVIKLEDNFLKVTASLGVASLAEDIVDAESLVSRADQALYEAKKKGRNQVISSNKEVPVYIGTKP